MPTGAGLAVSLTLVVLLGVVVFRALLRRGQREAHARAEDAERVPTLFPDAACRLWVIEGEQIVLAIEAGVGEATPGGRTVLALGEGIVGRVCASGEPVVLADVAEEAPDARNLAWMRARGVVSAAVVPLVSERCVGALAVVTRTRRIFGDEDVSLLRAFGEHAAVALEKTRVRT